DELSEPGPLVIVKVITVPAGALVEMPLLMVLTWPVMVWVMPTSLTPFGVAEMLASQVAKWPRAKSFNSAVNEGDERVWAVKLEKQPDSPPRAPSLVST